MNNSFREWFVFTRKERTGIIVLVVLILAATCLPWFFSVAFEKPDIKLTKEIAEKLKLVHKNTDSSAVTLSDGDDDRKMLPYDKPALKPATLFEFDPNTLSAAGWRQLGLRERAIQIIQKYLSRGGKFRQPADLKKIYGLSAELAARLLPYVRIHLPERPPENYQREEFPKFKKREPLVVDINASDSSAWIALPGIGSKLARRIITFREKLGGFYSIEQVKETYGLPDSTFQQITPLLKIGAEAVQTININTADAEILSRHPYINRNLANAIVKYRQQHGPYRSREDIRQIVLVTPEIFQKIVHYLAVE